MAQASPKPDEHKVVAFPGTRAEDGTERSDHETAENETENIESRAGGDPAAGPAPSCSALAMFEARGDQRMGQCLRAVREAQGLELNEIADGLRLSSRYLMAIERMEVGTVPKGYLTPYLRAYAGHLGLPADEVIEAFTAQCGGAKTVTRPQPIVAEDVAERPVWRHPLLVAAILIVLGGTAAYAVWPKPAGENGLAVTANQAPLNGARESLFANGDPAALGEIAQLPLMLVATRDAWIEVRGADGTIFRSRQMSEGERYYPRIGAGWTVTARDGGAFEWRVGDALIGPLGPNGAAVFAASVDTAAHDAAQSVAPALAAHPDAPPASQ